MFGRPRLDPSREGNMLLGRPIADGGGDIDRGGEPLIGRVLGGDMARAVDDGPGPGVRGEWDVGDVGRVIPEVRRAA